MVLLKQKLIETSKNNVKTKVQFSFSRSSTSMLNVLNKTQPESVISRNGSIVKQYPISAKTTTQRSVSSTSTPPPLERAESVVDFKKLISENTDEFCHHSTLHGLKYIVDESLYPAERIFFALSFVAVVLLSIFFISNVYTKWRSTPIIVGINPVPSFIVNEPFPAVTLCNLNQASKKRASQYREDSNEHAKLQHLCKREVNKTIADTIDWNSFEEFIFNISQPCEEMLKNCVYGAVEYNCADIFRTIVTDEGLCCVFNMLDPKFMYNIAVPKYRNITITDEAVPINWDPESGYPARLPEKFYPRKAEGTGETMGLSLTMDVDINDYYCSSATSVGVKMALHSPAEIPHVREIGMLLPAGRETKIRIRTDKTEAALNLKKMDKKYRQCLFEDEAKLDYFSYYNRRNCEIECQAQYLLEHCGCLAYYMPIINSTSRICGLKDTDCVEAARRNRLTTENSEQNSEDCQIKCWPSCFDLNFYSDFFSAPISNEGFYIANRHVANATSEHAAKSMAVVHFYFTDNTYRSSKQTEFVGMTDFLSSVGGLMGLFMGFSFISIAEFFYYAILRPYHVVKRHERLVVPSRKSKKSPNYHRPNSATTDEQQQEDKGSNMIGRSILMPSKKFHKEYNSLNETESDQINGNGNMLGIRSSYASDRSGGSALAPPAYAIKVLTKSPTPRLQLQQLPKVKIIE